MYERLAKYYDYFLDEELLSLYAKLIQKYYQDGSLIDLGTGTGALAIKMATLGFGVSGTDISLPMLEMAYNNAVQAGHQIRFYEQSITDPLPSVYDVITMVSDVINYLHTKEEVSLAFTHVKDAMSDDSIFIFDAYHSKYMETIHNHHEDILMHDDVIEWTVKKTNVINQIKHVVKIGRSIESHLQTTYPFKEYKKMLSDAGLKIIEKHRLSDRIVYVCRKK